MTRVVVGRVGRAHGIRGDVSIDLRTDEPERRLSPGSSVFVESDGRALTIESARMHGQRLLVTFAGFADRTAAEALRGSVLVVDVDDDETPDDPDEYYDRQLLGLAVVRTDGTRVGRVERVAHLPAQDCLEVRTHAGVSGDDGLVLVPFVAALVTDVDLAAGTVTVADVPGLLDPDAAVEARDPAAGGS